MVISCGNCQQLPGDKGICWPRTWIGYMHKAQRSMEHNFAHLQLLQTKNKSPRKYQIHRGRGSKCKYKGKTAKPEKKRQTPRKKTAKNGKKRQLLRNSKTAKNGKNGNLPFPPLHQVSVNNSPEKFTL